MALDEIEQMGVTVISGALTTSMGKISASLEKTNEHVDAALVTGFTFMVCGFFLPKNAPRRLSKLILLLGGVIMAFAILANMAMPLPDVERFVFLAMTYTIILIAAACHLLY